MLRINQLLVRRNGLRYYWQGIVAVFCSVVRSKPNKKNKKRVNRLWWVSSAWLVFFARRRLEALGGGLSVFFGSQQRSAQQAIWWTSGHLIRNSRRFEVVSYELWVVRVSCWCAMRKHYSSLLIHQRILQMSAIYVCVVKQPAPSTAHQLHINCWTLRSLPQNSFSLGTRAWSLLGAVDSIQHMCVISKHDLWTWADFFRPGVSKSGGQSSPILMTKWC